MRNEATIARDNETDIESLLSGIQSLIAKKQFAEADILTSNLVSAYPQHAEALYTNAVIKRLTGKDDAAVETLARLHDVAPEHARGYQERGYLHLASMLLQPAIAAFEKAVSLDSALIASWNALISLYELDNNAASARRAKVHFDRLKALPPELVGISTLINEKRYEKAELLCRRYLNRHPENVEAMRLLARIGVDLGITDDAEFLLEKALELKPDFHLARFDYVGVLQKRRDFEKAFVQAGYLLQSAPNDYNFLRLYANACMNVGRQEEAIDIYNKVLTIDPRNPQILLMCGHAAKTIGKVRKGIEYYRRCYAAKSDYGDAFWSLANLKTYTLDDRELDIAKGSESSDETSLVDRIHLCFAIGKAYEDRDIFDLSFDYYERGNTLKSKEFGYRSELVTAEVERQIDVCRKPLFDKVSGMGYAATDPVFIVGLPRAGSTLVEQILASHSDVDGTFELPNILSIVARLNGRRMANDAAKYPDILHALNRQELQALGKRYIDETRFHRSGAQYFTDKMPNNFRHIGLIKMILPNARIIDARRSPMACCFSGYKQLFAEGHAYTYDLHDMGRYYCDYIRMMDHWNSLFPNEILKVQYEDVVNDLSTQVSRILEYCELDVQQSCFDFHKTDRLIRTPSSEQVRQPIYRLSLEQWTKFDGRLQPLKSALGSHFPGSRSVATLNCG